MGASLQVLRWVEGMGRSWKDFITWLLYFPLETNKTLRDVTRDYQT